MGDMKNSPHNGPGTPRDDMTPGSGPGGNDMGFNMPPYQDNPGVNPVRYAQELSHCPTLSPAQHSPPKRD